MPKTTTQLRQSWRRFECRDAEMVVVPFGPDRIRIAPPTAEAWAALASVLESHKYQIRIKDTDSYNCRTITGGTGKSLHSFGIALDVNWTTNPYKDHAGNRQVRYSDKATQDERAEDVRHGRADTDMTPEMIADVEAIKTKDGLQVFEWGGSWTSHKDCMHFELDVSPEELEVGIDLATVKGWDDTAASPPQDHEPAGTSSILTLFEPAPAADPGITASLPDLRVVIARSGLRLRATASETSEVIRTIPSGTQVYVLAREGSWALIDLEGDQQADGFVAFSYLRSITSGPTSSRVSPILLDATDKFTVDIVTRMFPNTSKANIIANLPFVIAGLRAKKLYDRDMALMALGTIRAETEGFVPISEGRNRYNTRVTPFDLYEGRRDLGNIHSGDGPKFKGRGYVQLTGRDNYDRVGNQVGVDLINNPDMANDPALAGLILAQFLKNREPCVRSALGNRNLRAARKCVNGGTHGYERFRDAFEIGDRAVAS